MLGRMKAKDYHCKLENLTADAMMTAAEMLRTLAHPMRLRIIDLLQATGERPVGSITEYLGIAQSATSQHLNHMRREGLIRSERRGKEVWYSLADYRPIALLNCICNCCDRNA
jgi:ArsR family transcriptional regulator